jgi:hypothetical protein
MATEIGSGRMAAPRAELDHVTVMAASLGRGIDQVSEVLGATVPQGGKHPLEHVVFARQHMLSV